MLHRDTIENLTPQTFEHGQGNWKVRGVLSAREQCRRRDIFGQPGVGQKQFLGGLKLDLSSVE